MHNRSSHSAKLLCEIECSNVKKIKLDWSSKNSFLKRPHLCYSNYFPKNSKNISSLAGFVLSGAEQYKKIGEENRLFLQKKKNCFFYVGTKWESYRVIRKLFFLAFFDATSHVWNFLTAKCERHFFSDGFGWQLNLKKKIRNLLVAYCYY